MTGPTDEASAEITSVLDPEIVGEVLEVIRSLVLERMMMVMMTHELRFACEISHRVAYLSQGQIAEIGPPGDLPVGQARGAVLGSSEGSQKTCPRRQIPPSGLR